MPAAATENAADCPALTLWSAGCVVMVGAVPVTVRRAARLVMLPAEFLMLTEKAAPLSLAKEYPKWIAPWEALRHRHNLISPDLEAFVGLSFQYADYSMRSGHTEPGPPSIVSTVKINKAGFTEMMDTEAMFRNWFTHARASRLLP